MRKSLRVFPAFASLVLSGCSMIPDYRRPASPVPTTYPGGTERNIAADIRWRDFFTDPRLKRLVELSLHNNRDLRVAALTVDRYQALYRIQRAELLPEIDVSGNFTRSRYSSFIPGGTANTGTIGNNGNAGSLVGNGRSARTTSQYSVSVGTTAYEVDLFGRVRSLSQEALEQYFASDETRRSTEISLVAQVAIQYLTLLQDEEQLELSRRTLAATQESYDLNKKGYDAGRNSELDLSTADSQVQTARVDVFNYERLVAQAENYLALLVGEPLPDDLPAGRDLTGQGTFADLPAGLPSDLIARRPDIRAAEHTLIAANADIGAARAAFYPTISLTASGGLASTDLSDLFKRSSRVWSFAPQISVPIFDGGTNRATLDAAKLQKRIEVATYEKAIQTAFREVADALVARDRYASQLEAQQALVAAEQRRFDLSTLRYRQGIDSYLTVLTAQQDLYDAQSTLITTRADALANLITLYKSLGGGWETDELAPAGDTAAAPHG